ncbi:MAG TPA: hypothetical protein VGD19_12310 [Allosphingosinicella sp.]|jgi:DNA-binding CsgD family transcriptional regulator
MDTRSASAEARAGPQKRLRFAIAATVLQALAAVFFVADSLVDAQFFPGHEPPALSWMEVAIALALLAGTALGALLTRRLVLEARERERVIAVARGALAEVIAERFSSWRLSRAETDVALFALKGCTIAEIAGLRGSAEGTVRAQLSQVYAKAGVSSQALLMALFLEELL